MVRQTEDISGQSRTTTSRVGQVDRLSVEAAYRYGTHVSHLVKYNERTNSANVTAEMATAAGEFSQAVADLAFVIKKIVLEPLSGRRYPEMLQCLKELRKVASEVSLLTFAWSFLGTFLIRMTGFALGG